MTMSEATRPLSGLRVLDLAGEIGVYGARLLADLGADVLKVEPPAGDPQRCVGPFFRDTPDPERSLGFWYDNLGKRSAVLDPASESGRDTLIGLANVADLLIETGQPGEWAARGLDYATVSQTNPGLVWVAATGFGQTGPHANYLADDLIGWAASGWMSRCGNPDQPPLRGGIEPARRLHGIWAAVGALAGIQQRRRTGRGTFVDLSMQESLAFLVESVGLTYIWHHRVVKRYGSEYDFAVPLRIFPCKDGYVMAVLVTLGQWQTLVRLMAEDGMAGDLADERWLNNLERIAQRDHIHGLIGQWVARQEKQPFVARCQAAKLPVGMLSTMADVAVDPQLAARHYFSPVTYPELDASLPVGGWPFLLDRQPSPPSRRSPRLGEHQVAVAEWLGGVDGPHSPAPADPSPQPPPLQERGSRRLLLPLGEGRGEGLPLPLSGLRILDFTWAAAGPSGVRILADLGADVVKVEPRDVGEMIRGYPPFRDDVKGLNLSGYFFQVNRNKRGITLNLKHPRGIELARELAAQADLVIDNFSGGVMERLGLGADALRARNPRLLVISVPAFGAWGPRQNYVGFAPTVESFSGVSATTGYADGVPTGMGQALPDYLGGLTAALAALAGLEWRERTGTGGAIEAAMFTASVQLHGPALLDYFANGRILGPQGNRHPYRDGGPFGVYRCTGDDRWLAVSALTEEQWRAFRTALDNPAWADRSEFATPEGRRQHADLLDSFVEAWTAARSPEEAAATLQAAGVPAYPFVNGRDLVEDDPQLRAREFWPLVEHPELGAERLDRSPLIFDGAPLPIRRPAPLLGEHTEQVLSEWLGYSDETIVDLIVEEVV